MGQREDCLLTDLYVGQVVVPNAVRLFPFAEENQICFHARACARKHAARQTNNAINVALLQKLSLYLHECFRVHAK